MSEPFAISPLESHHEHQWQPAGIDPRVINGDVHLVLWCACGAMDLRPVPWPNPSEDVP